MRRQGDHGAPTELVLMESHRPSRSRQAAAPGTSASQRWLDPPALPLMARELLASLGLQVVVMHSAPPTPPRLVEVDELAAVLGVTRWSVYRWAAQGRIPCVRAGRKVRFELERVIAALRSEGPRVEASPAMPSVQVTAGSRATRMARPRETPKCHRVAGGIASARCRRAEHNPRCQRSRKRAAARQEPVDEIARRRAIVAATRSARRVAQRGLCQNAGHRRWHCRLPRALDNWERVDFFSGGLGFQHLQRLHVSSTTHGASRDSNQESEHDDQEECEAGLEDQQQDLGPGALQGDEEDLRGDAPGGNGGRGRRTLAAGG